ncbi:nucleotidyltransferase family protein [Candidatus Woesearchaeota archaeon]|nr:nucleotidyltransferase family protein [Candidatus Woesearchaeota archaeon]
MQNTNDFRRIKSKIVKVLRKHKIRKAGIFGSYATGTYKKRSDIDILIQPPKGIGFGFVGIQYELEDALGKKVDLVTYNSLNPYLKKGILREEVRIL